MKTNIKVIAIAIMFCVTEQIFAQIVEPIRNDEVEGIYLTLTDFKLGKLTIPTDKQHKGDKINLKQFFYSSEITSIEEDKETVFYKDSIFAIRLSSGKNYRFINRTPCLIADTSYLYIYTQKTTKTEYKQSGPRRISKQVPITYFYFSTGYSNTVYMLTLANIRKYVLTDSESHKIICDQFTTDEMLYKVNPQTGLFVLNESLLKLKK